MNPFIDQAPERIWLHGVGDTVGETTWAADPSPSGDPLEAEHAIAYVRNDVVAAQREQWRHLLTSMLEHCRTAGLDMVSTLYRASGDAIAAMKADAAVPTAKVDDLRLRLQERIRDGHCAEDTEDGDVNFCGSCHWCLHVTSERMLSVPTGATDQARTPAETNPTLLRAQAISSYPGPVVSFDVAKGFHLASCDGCGWVGSSEKCGTDRDRDDSDVYCPRCHASGADHGTVASRIDVGTS